MLLGLGGSPGEEEKLFRRNWYEFSPGLTLRSEGAELVQLPGNTALSWLLPFLLVQGREGKELQGAFVVLLVFSLWSFLCLGSSEGSVWLSLSGELPGCPEGAELTGTKCCYANRELNR